MLNLSELESQRKKYKEGLDNLKKLEGEGTQLSSEKDRIRKMIVEAGIVDDEALFEGAVAKLKSAVTDIETKLTDLTAKIDAKIS